jgi:hypothetical protein
MCPFTSRIATRHFRHVTRFLSPSGYRGAIRGMAGPRAEEVVPCYSRVRGGVDDSIDKNMARTVPTMIPLAIHIKPPISLHGEVNLQTVTIYDRPPRGCKTNTGVPIPRDRALGSTHGTG